MVYNLIKDKLIITFEELLIMKCSKCGKKIKNIYTWNGEIFGIECWKQVALPELEKQRELKYKDWNEKKAILVEVAKIKDTSKLSNEFKLNILTSIPKFFDENGFITNRQYDLLKEQFNNKDRVIFYNMLNEADLIEYEEYLNRIAHNTTGKAHQEAIEKMDAHYDMLAAQYDQEQMTV
jgi:hypothetical protein